MAGLARQARRRQAAHAAALSLARDASVIATARRLVEDHETRLARIGALSAFVGDASRRLPPDVCAALLVALLRAAGERARLEYTRELIVVRVAVTLPDVARLPPFAGLVRSGPDAFEIALAPWQGRAAFGYLPPDVRDGLRRRRALRT